MHCAGDRYSDSFAFWEKNLTYEGESVYNYLQVSEDDTSVRLSTNVLFGVQSVYMKQSRLTGMYYDYELAAPLTVADKNPSDMVCADPWNGGTGNVLATPLEVSRDMNVEGVEIDEKHHRKFSPEVFLIFRGCAVTTYLPQPLVVVA